MGRDNYSFKKRQRELATKKKHEEKMQRKLEKKNLQDGTNPTQVPSEGAPPA